MAKSRDNDLFIVKDDGYIYYYQPEKQLFQKLEVPQIAFGHVLSTIIDKTIFYGYSLRIMTPAAIR